ncbi:OpgC domain-containing protein [Bradyrhizobium japonicum]|uniref:OpgC domain-containing protein n=1 Tax=Bradyrhizobium japonicum TaxID=375 RepID=UPI003F7324B3
MRETFGDARTAVLVGPGKRDLRLDLLRGAGQWMVFLDHIPFGAETRVIRIGKDVPMVERE